MVEIRRGFAPEEREAWGRLFAGYLAFYDRPIEERARTVAVVWDWLAEPDHPLRGLAARDGGELVGIAHYRPMPRPTAGVEIGFLDDLFVDPGARGRGVGAALLAELRQIAVERGWASIRWLTAEGNVAARRLYDRDAALLPFVLYDMPTV